MQSRFNPLLLVSVLIGLASMAAVVPAWAFAPFAVTTAAAGLYLAYTRSGSTKPIDPDEDKIYDLGQCAEAKETVNNPDYADEKVVAEEVKKFYKDNATQLNKYWKQRVHYWFVDQDHADIPDHLRLQPYSKEEKLPDKFELYFRPEKWTWTDLNVAKADIEDRIQRIRRNALLPFF